MNKQSPAYIIFFILALSTFFGLAISIVNYSTVDLLKKNEEMHRNRVIAQVFSLSVSGTSADAYREAVTGQIDELTITWNGRQFPYLKNRENDDTGIFFRGTGFWDAITGIMVLSPDLQTIKNIKFLDQKETPGLGARIEEEAFTDSFMGLQIDWQNQPDKRIIIGPSPDPNAVNRVDAITGATQTSIALMDMLNRDLDIFRRAYKGEE